MAGVPMSELLPDYGNPEGQTIVTLSKTREQKDGPLRGVNFTNHIGIIMNNSSITRTRVSVRLPLNRELFGYDVEIPDGHEIDENMTQIVPRNDVIEVRIVKFGNFPLNRLN